ncbi:sensor histidine kinase/response regulator [Venturia nashicola]|uniref:histidine kinase n=1 Tax=Venturia nashicola TaxID=86259 RepID=A0A4Z1NWF3_9PEZI|nr:sensor histidine kinase/response regulator [Venturia nashicola]
MTGFVERIFPIRIHIDAEREHRRLGQKTQSKEPFSTKRLDRSCHEDKLPPASEIQLQGFGTLLGLRRIDPGQYQAAFVTDNSTTVLGITHQDILAHKSFCDSISAPDKIQFLARLNSLLDYESNRNEPHCITFQCSIQSSQNASTLFWCTSHKPKDYDDIVICEFEPHRSDLARAKHSQAVPRKPLKIFSYEPSAEDWIKSTTRANRPVFPWYGTIDEASPTRSTDLINAMSEVQTQLIGTTSMDSLFGVIVGTISELADFDRVMLYRFDECRCGAVVAEYLCPQASEDLFLGLHFPSSDLPIWTRELYKKDRVQLLRSRTSDKTSIVYRNKDKLGIVDLTKSYLRDIGPDKVGLFADLDVSSAMTTALVVEGELWGMVMCHSYGSKVVEILPPAREMFRTIGDCISSQIERLTYAERLEARVVLATGLSQKSPTAFITGSSSTILRLFTSEYGLLVMDDEARAVGKLASYQEALVLVQYLRARGVTSVMASQKITHDFPDLMYAPGFNNIAGLLAIPLSRSGSDFLVLFRKEQLMEIHWAGNTQERFELLGMENIEPAASFQRWVEHVTQTSLEIAGVLSRMYGTFTDFWRKRQMKIHTSRIRQILISNSSHEVRTPLNHIINYLELALDFDLDETARGHIEASLTSSKSLLYAINDLLDLTKVEDSNTLLHEEPFSLRDVMLEVVGSYAAEAERKGIAISFDVDSMFLIEQVIGDSQRLCQAVSNILSNALAHSDHGVVDVEIYPDKGKTSTDLENTLVIAIGDQGRGMTEQQLDDLFMQLENLLDDEAEEDEDEGTVTAPTPTASIGLGLSVVARYVRNSNGQVKIETMVGRGTRVSLQLPLRTTTCALPDPLPTPPSDFGPQETPTTATLSRTIISDSSKSTNLSHPSRVSSSPAMSQSSVTTTESITSENISFPFPLTDRVTLHILVAEDNTLNAKVMKMQLRKLGHDVTVVGDGQACLDKFISDTTHFDLILMDFQMPIVDGPTSAKAIRAHEDANSPKLSRLASIHGNIPIFAVSASLVEEKRKEYIEGGFNGWILKPIRFTRLNAMMSGIWNEDVKKQFLYSPGNWENGGWLT